MSYFNFTLIIESLGDETVNEEPYGKKSKPSELSFFFFQYKFYLIFLHPDEGNGEIKIIMQKLHKMDKRESMNSSNIKTIMQMLMEEDPWVSFSFPLKELPELDKFERCLLKQRFTKKLVIFC